MARFEQKAAAEELMKRSIIGAIFVAAALCMVSMWPDIERYRRIRAM